MPMRVGSAIALRSAAHCSSLRPAWLMCPPAYAEERCYLGSTAGVNAGGGKSGPHRGHLQPGGLLEAVAHVEALDRLSGRALDQVVQGGLREDEVGPRVDGVA